jgi:hypothetical protein
VYWEVRVTRASVLSARCRNLYVSGTPGESGPKSLLAEITLLGG